MPGACDRRATAVQGWCGQLGGRWPPPTNAARRDASAARLVQLFPDGPKSDRGRSRAMDYRQSMTRPVAQDHERTLARPAGARRFRRVGTHVWHG